MVKFIHLYEVDISLILVLAFIKWNANWWINSFHKPTISNYHKINSTLGTACRYLEKFSQAPNGSESQQTSSAVMKNSWCLMLIFHSTQFIIEISITLYIRTTVNRNYVKAKTTKNWNIEVKLLKKRCYSAFFCETFFLWCFLGN